MTAARDWSGFMAGFAFVMAWAFVGAAVAEGWARDWAHAPLWLVGVATWLWIRRLWQRIQRRRAEWRRWHAYLDARFGEELKAPRVRSERSMGEELKAAHCCARKGP